MPRWIGKLTLFGFLWVPLFASVELKAPESVKVGEEVVFKIIARGFEITFPEIDFIEGQLVQELKSMREAYIIGIAKATQMTKVYKVLVKKDFTIPALAIHVDGKVEMTQAHRVSVKKIEKTVSDNFSLQMQINKYRAYLGEKLILKMIFIYKDLEDYQLIKPKFDGFRVKKQSEKSYQTTKGMYVEEQEFELLAQEPGNFVLSASKAEVEFFPQGKSHKYSNIKKVNVYSNSLTLDVVVPPKNVEIVGHYEMLSTVFNQKVKQGEAVKMRLEIIGEGNINNLNNFSFTIDNAMVYTKKRSDHSMQKDFEIIADEDFEIPSLTLTYFDITQDKIIKIKSPSYKILVGDVRSVKKKVQAGTALSKKIVIKEKEMTIMEKISYVLVGVLLTLIAIFSYKKLRTFSRISETSALMVRLRKIHNQERFFKALIPFLGRDKDLDRLIYKLEACDDKAFKQLKVDTLQRMKSLQL